MKHSRKIPLLIGLLWIAGNAFSNDTLLMSQLLRNIDRLQAKESSVFPAGMIPSYRIYALNKDRQKADINAFYTGLLAFTLRDIRPELTPAQQQYADNIITRTLPVYDKFRNRKGRPTYNFWPTDTPQIFPHSGWMNLFNKSQALPDDLDDTVIMLLAMQASRATAAEAHTLMQGFTNNGNKKVRNTFEDYRNIAAYSTWFGQKMPVDFDVCVLANVLYFVQSYNLPWTAADSASLQLIEKVLSEKKHVTDAPYVSPHYSRLPNIVYHLSRLMAVKPIPSLENYRQELIDQTQQAFADADNMMEEVLLSTSLLRWGVVPGIGKAREAGSLEALVEDEQFSFFIANMASMLPDPLKQWMGGAGIGKFYYYCPGYNYLLLLENLVWRKKKGL